MYRRAMHTVTGRWKLGLMLALTTAVCWGVLPLALKLALQGMDAYTITWYRFAVSGVVLGLILAATRNLPSLRPLGSRVWWLLLIALLGLTSNYVLYLLALNHTTATIAQVVVQLGPMFFLLGGVVVFKERFNHWQVTGFLALVMGLLLFFNRRLPELADLSGGTGVGVALVIVASAVWAAYGLAQKQLLRQLNSQQILLLVYVGAIVILFPTAALNAIVHLSALQFWMLAFSCVNTLVAYGAFAEALEHWEVSRVGAILSLAPLFTIASAWLMEHFTPGLLAVEDLNALSIAGALLVVGGSAGCALAASNGRNSVVRTDL